ncbi:MAG: serine protease Do [Candidatus Tokpelaia sp. JSC161]|jgi:serine protease Do|nr:MAG: serine protease Do [Candidatus Tokpelaia sp. JSC161]
MTGSYCNFFTRQVFAAISISAMLFPVPLISNTLASPVYVRGLKIPSFSDVVDQVKPAVVSVQVKSNVRDQSSPISDFWGGYGLDQLPENHPLKRFFREFGERHIFKNKEKERRMRPVAQGSGFFISDDGYIVTNNHVIADGTSYVVVLDNGKEIEAKLVGADSRTDIAVLKIESKGNTYVDFANDNDIKIGDWVVAVGNPFGLGGTVTAGIVSARGRDIGAGVYDDFIQIDAAVNRGNSGGPTFNLKGQVVGINTAIFSPSGGSVGIAFSIPASTAGEVVRQLIEHGMVERGWLGVQIQPVTKEIADSVGLTEAKGAIVSDPMDGPAFKAGIRAGNVILSVNDALVADPRDLARRIAAVKPGEKVRICVWRNGKKEDVLVKIASMPASRTLNSESSEEDGSFLKEYGLAVLPAEDGKGVLVTNVDSESDAAEKGIRPGDIIRTLNGKPVITPSDMTVAIKKAIHEKRTAILMQIETNEQTHFIALSLQ